MVSSDGTSSTALVTSDGAVQGGGGGGGSSNPAAIGTLTPTTVAGKTPAVLYTFEGTINDISGNGRNLAVEGGAISTDAEDSGYVYKLGAQWLGLNGSTNLVYSTDDATLKHTGDITIFCQMMFLTDNLVDGWIIGHGEAGGASASNWLYAILWDGANFEYFHEYVGGSNAENPLQPPKSAMPFAPHTACIRRTDNLDGTWTIDYFFDGRWMESDSFVDSVEPAGGADGRLRVGGFDGGGYVDRALIRNTAIYLEALSDAEILTMNNVCNGST